MKIDNLLLNLFVWKLFKCDVMGILSPGNTYTLCTNIYLYMKCIYIYIYKLFCSLEANWRKELMLLGCAMDEKLGTEQREKR